MFCDETLAWLTITVNNYLCLVNCYKGMRVQTGLNFLCSLGHSQCPVSDSGSRANGLLERFLKGKTVLGLMVASEVLGELECLNRSLQKQSETIGGMQAVTYVSFTLQGKELRKSLGRSLMSWRSCHGW